MNMGTKILNKILANRIQQTLKESYTIIKWGLSQGYKDSSIHANHACMLEHAFNTTGFSFFILPQGRSIPYSGLLHTKNCAGTVHCKIRKRTKSALGNLQSFLPEFFSCLVLLWCPVNFCMSPQPSLPLPRGHRNPKTFSFLSNLVLNVQCFTDCFSSRFLIFLFIYFYCARFSLLCKLLSSCSERGVLSSIGA